MTDMNLKHMRGRQTNLVMIDEIAYIDTKEEMVAKFGMPFIDPFGHRALRDAGIYVIDEPGALYSSIFQQYVNTRTNKNYYKTITVK